MRLFYDYFHTWLTVSNFLAFGEPQKKRFIYDRITRNQRRHLSKRQIFCRYMYIQQQRKLKQLVDAQSWWPNQEKIIERR